MDITGLSDWAEYLAHPLVLVGFVIMLVVGLISTLIKRGTILPKETYERFIRQGLRFVFIISLIVVILGFGLAFKKEKRVTHTLTTKGHQSPIIISEGESDVTVSYGISEELLEELGVHFTPGRERIINRLLKELDEKDIAIEKREAIIKEWVERYKELEGRLAARSTTDDIAVLAKEELDVGDLEGAEKILKDSLKKNLRELSKKSKAAAVDAYELGFLKELQLEYQLARDYYEQAVQLAPKNADYLNRVGLILRTLGKATKAIEYYEKALAINLKDFGNKHPNVATNYNNLGLAWKDLGNTSTAISYFENALSINKAAFKDNHPTVAINYNNLGMAWDDLGDERKAIDYFEKALAIDMEVFGYKHPNVARRYNNLGAAWKDLGNTSTAISYFENALSINKAAFKDNHPTIAINYNNLAMAQKDLGNTKAAIRYLEKALDIDLRFFKDKHPSVAIDYFNLGLAWHDLGDTGKATEYFKMAFDIFNEAYGSQHPNTIKVQDALHNLSSRL